MLRSKLAPVMDENSSKLLNKNVDATKKTIKEKPRLALCEVGNVVASNNKLPEKKLTKGNTLNKIVKLPVQTSKPNVIVAEKKKQPLQSIKPKLNVAKKETVLKKVVSHSTISLLKKVEHKKDIAKFINRNDKEVTDDVESYSSKVFPLSIPNIDASDMKDPFMVSEYVQDIYKYLKQKEEEARIKEDFLKSHSSTPRMRKILIDWISDVQSSFNFLPETLYLSTAIIDQYLQLNPTIGRDNLQLVGTTAMFIASKYEEIVIPLLSDFVYICDDFYTKAEILKMEKEMAKKLDFKFNIPLSIQFYRRCSKVGNATQESYSLGKYILELSLLDHKMCCIKGSLKAAAAYCLAASIITDASDPSSVWTNTLIHYTCYTYPDLKKAILQMAVLLKNAPDSKQQTARKKYSSSKCLNVSMNPKLNGPLMTKLIHEATISK